MKIRILVIVEIITAILLACLFIIPDKDIDNLRLWQEGMTLKATWDKEKAPYKVVVDGVEYPSNANEFTLPMSKPHICKVRVMSYGSFFPKIAEKEIKIEKIEQNIRSELRYALIEGEKVKIRASALGKITFKTKGGIKVKGNKLKALKPGRFTLTIHAAEGDYFKDATREVEVAVYPKELKPPILEIKSDDKINCSLKYKKVPYGEKYTLYRNGKICKEYSNLPRDGSTYYVVAETLERGVKSTSNKIVLNPYSETAKEYEEPHLISTLEKSDFREVASIAQGGYVPQSFCLAEKMYVVSFTSRDGKSGYLVKYSMSGKRLKAHKVEMGYGNGSTYNPKTKRIYTVRTHNKKKSDKCTSFDINGKNRKVAKLPGITSGIAYMDGNYILSKGPKIEITNRKFKSKGYFKKVRYKQAQDIGAGNGVIIVALYDGVNYVDIYRKSDGAYLGGYMIPFGEIESVLTVDKKLVILMHNTEFNGTRSGKILVSKEQFPLL